MSVANTEFKKRVMRRIYIISVLRQVFHPVVLKSAMLAVFVLMTSVLVSVPNVIENMPTFTDLGASLRFILRAFVQTETLVQIFSLGSIFLIAWLIKDALKSFSFFSHHKSLAS